MRRTTVKLALLLGLFCLAAVPLQAQVTLSFTGVSDNIAGDVTIGEAQLTVVVTDAGSGQVLFTFLNVGPDASSITDVYFDDGSLLGIASIDNSDSGVSFTELARPGNLPSANDASPPFVTTAGFSADSDPPAQPNPLDAPAVGDFIHRYRVTILLATPTFLQLYMRGCTPAQLGSLRLVLTGAEKLSERLASAFEEQFGIRPLEGYGSTECSPVIAVSVPDFRAPGFFQPGSRRGFVGQPLPGVAVRIVDPDSFEPLSADEQGMLIVRGPNVMKGYLGRDDLTQSVLREGWYVTGDIALVNEDGFLKITDRLSRFSKIGGEMVPHGKVEEALHQAAELDHQVFSVTAVADDRKGESLVVIHVHDEEAIPEILKKLGEMGLPNLFIPRKDRFLKVDELPVLGTGKINLKEAKRIATEHFE